MMVVITDAILEASRRPGRLQSSEKSSCDQHAERVVHRLQRDRADLRPHHFGNPFRGDVGFTRDGSEHREPLCSHLDPMSTKEACRVGGHRQSE